MIEERPTTRHSSTRKAVKMLEQKRGKKASQSSVARALRGDLGLKTLARAPATRLSEKQKQSRAQFAEKYIKLVGGKEIDAAPIFWSDEKLFTANAAPA